MNSKSLIFDVDGTLWDATAQITNAYNQVLETINPSYPKISKKQMENVMGLLIEEIAEEFFPYLSYSNRMNLIEACCNNENAYLKKNGGILYPEMLDVLQSLKNKGYKMYIVSNCQDGYIESMFTAYPNLKPFFLDYECSGRTHLIKGENIQLIMKRNNLQDAIYIGDTKKDKEASDFANIPFIYAAYGFGKVADFDARITQFKDLKEIL